MIECESVRGKWGGVCPDCGATLPNPKPIRSWQAVRHEGSDDHRRVVIDTHFYRKHRNAGIYAKRKKAAA